jgi:hypothetical protein
MAETEPAAQDGQAEEVPAFELADPGAQRVGGANPPEQYEPGGQDTPSAVTEPTKQA